MLAAARIAVSAVALVLVARWLDVGAVAARLSDLRPGWVTLGLAITVAQVALLAWRWRYTAARLGVELPFREALGEYYLGIFLNQLLPGGVLGDVSRAWRHSRGVESGEHRPVVHAVVLERVSAQVVMTAVALGSLIVLPWAAGVYRVGAALAAAVGPLALMWLLRPSGPRSAMGRLREDAQRAFVRGAVAPQLASAVLVVASYIAVFVVAARAIGVQTPFATLLPLVAPVLMTMLVPVSVAGWGLREAAAAALWSGAGLTPEDGAAISVAYGLLVLVSSAPGALPLTRALIAGRDRTARPPRAGSDGTPA